jgi:hypothetical protein
MAMEDNAKNFLVLIVQTVSSIILWLMMNILFGLYLKYGLFKTTPSIINIVYYIVFIIGSFLLFRFFKKRWQAIDLN